MEEVDWRESGQEVGSKWCVVNGWSRSVEGGWSRCVEDGCRMGSSKAADCPILE